MNSRPRPEWTLVKTFERDDVTVRVEKLDLGFFQRPKFSLKIGQMRNDRFVPVVPLKFEGLGRVEIQRVAATVLALVTEAEDWAHNEVQQFENDRIEARIEREAKQVNAGKPEVRVTGKTQKNRDKRKGASA